jgi:hypothetical protein
MKRQMTQEQHERQRHRERSGRYSKVNPCYRCGKSAGENYTSVLDSECDSLGNNWGDSALCLCWPCGGYMAKLTETNPQAAWDELQSPKWGKFPQATGDE